MGLVVLLVVMLIVREPRREARPPDLDGATVQPAAAAAALHRFVEGVTSRDADVARQAAPPDDDVVAEHLAALAANADQLAVVDFTARYVDQVGSVSPDGSWTAAAALTWRFEGFDRRPARSEVLVRFGGGGEDVGVVGFGASASGAGRLPLWLRGPLAVVRRDRSLVVVDGPPAVARAVSDQVRRGIAVVRRMLPQWRPRAVVEMPASGAELDETLGAQGGTYSGVAAVTTTADGSARSGTPTHVYVNPDVSGRLRPLGAQVVMSHELAHVATGAATSAMDDWLLEGFADYVALRDVRLSDRVSLARVIRLVRRTGVPDHLPGPDEFDTRAEELEAAYEQAWLACRIVAERLGEGRLVALYRAADRGTPLGVLLRRAGLPEPVLVRAWQERLQDLAG